MTVTRTISITCALLAAASAAVAQVPAQEPQAAQQQAPPAPPQTPAHIVVDSGLKGVVRLYEYALNDAIIRAGTNLQNWAREKVGPGLAVYIVPAAPPKVSAMLLPDNSLAFDIHLAEMNVTGLEIAMQMKPAQQQRGQGDAKVTATGLGLTPPDPVAPASPAVTSGGKPVSASQAYSDFVREALLDTLVGQGHLLPIGPGQTLTVQVTPVDVAVTNVFDKNPSRKLILSIKGDDLEQFRQKALTKEQLLLRVIDVRF